MIKKILFIFSITFLSILLLSPVCFPQAILSNYHSFYSSFDPNATSYIYDPNNAVAATSGQYYCYNYTFKTIQISVPTLGSSSLDVRIEGKVDNASTWSDIYSKQYTAATTIDESVMVTEHMEYIRVGLKITGNSTDSVSITGNFGVPRYR